MKKNQAKIKEWPFQKGESTKLIWIGEPFKQNNKWMINSYFKGDKNTRRVLLDWASLHFLVTGKYYIDGDLNNAEVQDNSEVININLNSIKVEYRQRPWEIWGTGFKDKTTSKTFSFVNQGDLYIIPIIEIIRAVLAPSKFMLNRILEMDSFENYFTYTIDKRRLEIHFTWEYDKKLLKDDKINHLAWLLTNHKVIRMFNNIGQSIWQDGELKFGFSLDDFNIKALVEKKGTYTKVLEILALKKKKINVEEINVYHPSLEESKISNEAKIRKYINKNSCSDRDLTSDGDGATKTSEEINTLLITHEYERLPQIHRSKKGIRITRKKENENTKKYILEDDRLRTTADGGGEEVIRGLEFINRDNVDEKGELEEFIGIIRLLGDRHDIRKVDIIIGELSQGRKAKRFSVLSDGITRRKYAIGKIVMMDGKERSLIDVERENRALSMLIIKANILVDWKGIYSLLLLGLVDESGKWSNEAIDKIKKNGANIYRSKHISKNIFDKEIHVYKKIL
ncbi:Tn7-like element transposition protein TnsE [Clostridium akagii]|uniref:Tn7-like element transposition protein TnsE n=1 Tax=Clostridium akagii TaxID=91623 RepID=UPI00047985ED|nr:Tn7-like element transposition protein TnsE [Clostridium akagii]